MSFGTFVAQTRALSRLGPIGRLSAPVAIRSFTRSACPLLKEEPESGRRNGGFFKSILLGSPKAVEEEQATHSKILARGKYVHEIQKHMVKPESIEDYINLISTHYPMIANDPENKVNLCGSWVTEVGDQDSFVHIWEYKGYPGHKETLERLNQDKEYKNFVKKLLPMLRSRENQICLEFGFWPTKPPTDFGAIYELRSYLLRPGNLLEWELNWRKGLECRRQFCEPVGAWFSQLGSLNYVHHMWAYPDLQTRKETREAAWQIEGWPKTVYNTVRLIDNMHAAILRPLSFSPLK